MTWASDVFSFPRMAEHDIATNPMMAPTKKVTFIAFTNTAGFAGVAVADASPL